MKITSKVYNLNEKPFHLDISYVICNEGLYAINKSDGHFLTIWNSTTYLTLYLSEFGVSPVDACKWKNSKFRKVNADVEIQIQVKE